MNPCKRLRLGAVAGIIVVGLVPVLSSGASGATPAPPRAAEPPPRYLYSATFTATATSDLRTSWGGSDYEERDISAHIAGSFPELEVTASDHPLLPFDIVARGTGMSVEVTSAKAKGVFSVNDGQLTSTCTADSARVQGTPILVSGVGGTTLTPFASLDFDTTCTHSEGPPTDGAYVLSIAQMADGGSTSKAGDAAISLPFGYEVGTAPYYHPELCPGYIPGQTQICSYVVEGTLDLTLVKKLDPAPTPSTSQGAKVTPGAKKAKVPVLCPARCKVKIELLPLRGGPRLTVPKVFSPKAGKVSTLSVAIPAKKRKLVTQAGGLSVRLTYRLPGGIVATETRRARF